jgi:hypothetical protein
MIARRSALPAAAKPSLSGQATEFELEFGENALDGIHGGVLPPPISRSRRRKSPPSGVISFSMRPQQGIFGVRRIFIGMVTVR